MVSWFFISIPYHSIMQCTESEKVNAAVLWIIHILHEFRSVGLRREEWTTIPGRLLFFHFCFPFGGKDKTGWESWIVALFAPWPLLLQHLSKDFSFRNSHSLSYFNWLISFNSNHVLLYCIISHSATVFSKLSCFFPGFLVQACLPAFSLSFLPTPQGMDPCMSLPPCHKNHA